MNGMEIVMVSLLSVALGIGIAMGWMKWRAKSASGTPGPAEPAQVAAPQPAPQAVQEPLAEPIREPVVVPEPEP